MKMVMTMKMMMIMTRVMTIIMMMIMMMQSGANRSLDVASRRDQFTGH